MEKSPKIHRLSITGTNPTAVTCQVTVVFYLLIFIQHLFHNETRRQVA